jgi:outer membrane protein assembly factor BamB
VKRTALWFITLAAGLSLGGCSWFGGWFGSDSPKLKPAELTEFKATAVLKRAWDASVGDGRPYAFTPGTDGQAIYAAGKGGKIVRIDPATGREVWRAEAGQTLSAGAGVGEGLVLVGTPKGEVLAFRSVDGQPAWQAKLSGEILTPPVAGKGWVAARSNDGKVYLLNAADGKQRWVYSRALPALILREPGNLALGEAAVFAGHPGGKLTALSLVNGAPLWEVNVTLPRGANELERIADVSGALALDERVICAAAYQGRVACFDQAAGTAVWGREFSGLTGVDLDGRNLYAADDAATLQAFDKQRGISLWKQDKLRDRRLSTPLALGRHVAAGDLQGYVHLFDADTGALAARAATDGSPVVGQILPLDRGLVVQTVGGGIHAFKIEEAGSR